MNSWINVAGGRNLRTIGGLFRLAGREIQGAGEITPTQPRDPEIERTLWFLTCGQSGGRRVVGAAGEVAADELEDGFQDVLAQCIRRLHREGTRLRGG